MGSEGTRMVLSVVVVVAGVAVAGLVAVECLVTYEV